THTHQHRHTHTHTHTSTGTHSLFTCSLRLLQSLLSISPSLSPLLVFCISLSPRPLSTPGAPSPLLPLIALSFFSYRFLSLSLSFSLSLYTPYILNDNISRER